MTTAGGRTSATPAVARAPAPRLTYLVKQAELAIRAHLDRIVSRQELTTLQYTALSVLERNPGISSAQLSRRSFVTAQAGNEMVGVLERKGLIERQPSPAHLRIRLVYLTTAGAALLDACDAEVDALEARMLHGVDAAARRQLRAGLESCTANLHDAGVGSDVPRHSR
jgi:DNA-binding MarR family transcriptional regulator